MSPRKEGYSSSGTVGLLIKCSGLYPHPSNGLSHYTFPQPTVVREGSNQGRKKEEKREQEGGNRQASQSDSGIIILGCLPVLSPSMDKSPSTSQ